MAKRAGVGHVHPHQLRHTLATRMINRGMSLEAIAALLGHRSMRMTLTYARISDRTVAEEYFRVTQAVEASYESGEPFPASVEGANMRRIAAEHRRLLGNGHCTRPTGLDCTFESVCERCGFFETGPQFLTILRRQRDDAVDHGQDDRVELLERLHRRHRRRGLTVLRWLSAQGLWITHVIAPVGHQSGAVASESRQIRWIWATGWCDRQSCQRFRVAPGAR